MNCHLVFSVKRNADGSIDKFKVRVVVNGQTQKHGVDFDRVFSTVVKMSTVRLLLAIACKLSINGTVQTRTGPELSLIQRGLP
jgi:hypothetical protein